MTPATAAGWYASHSLCAAKNAVASAIIFHTPAARSFPPWMPNASSSSSVTIQRAPYAPASVTAIRYDPGNGCFGGAASIHGVQSGCFAAHNWATHPLESTHGTPVGPALAPPPRDICTPGHSPLEIHAPSGGAFGCVTLIPDCSATARMPSNSSLYSTSTQSMPEPFRRFSAEGWVQAAGHRIGVQDGFISYYCI